MSDLRVLKWQVQRQLKQDLEKANRFFNREFAFPLVSYALRGQKAGVAYLRENEIRLNPVLLQENGFVFVQQVVPHELAHLLVYQQFGRVRPHGKEWKAMMEQVLGVPAHIYHTFDTSSVATQYAYQCGCQIHKLSVRRHNAIQQNQRSYICKKCQQSLRLIINY